MEKLGAEEIESIEKSGVGEVKSRRSREYKEVES